MGNEGLGRPFMHRQPHHRTVVFLHGILGSLKNWRTPARRLIGRHSHYQALVVDHRGHGASERGAPPHDLAACAADVRELLCSLNLRCDMLCGHSYGGKVALAYVRAGLERKGACVYACAKRGWHACMHTTPHHKTDSGC